MFVSLRKLARLLGVSRKALVAASRAAGGSYESFDLRAPGSSKWRHIDHPDAELLAIQRQILRRILDHVELPPTLMGGLSGCTIKDHAEPHCRKAVVVTLDLAHCFPSVSNRRVFRLFTERLDFSPALAGLLTKLTTRWRRLPQGAPTSTHLAALALEALHLDIAKVCKRRGLSFTQWVDDLAISGPDGTEGVLSEVVALIQKHGFAAARPKILVMRSSERQVVTGIVVNRGLSAGARRMTKIKKQIEHHADALFLLDGESRSLVGQIGYAKWLRTTHGARLGRYAARKLPPVQSVALVMPQNSGPEHRDCNCSTRHRTSGLSCATRSPRQPTLPGLGRRFLGQSTSGSRKVRARKARQTSTGMEQLSMLDSRTLGSTPIHSD